MSRITLTARDLETLLDLLELAQGVDSESGEDMGEKIARERRAGVESKLRALYARKAK